MSDRMFLRLLIVDQRLALAAKPARFRSSDAHNREARVAFAEDGVHLLEAAAGGFGIEEVDDGDDEGVSVNKRGGGS